MAVKNYRLYRERRRKLAAMLGRDGIIFVPGAKHTYRNADTEYPFRQESSFFYLTGFTEPNALLIIVGGAKPRSILFCDPKDEEEEIWTGKRFGIEAAKKTFGFHRAIANTGNEARAGIIKDLLRDRQHIYYPEHRGVGAEFRDLIELCFKGVEGRNKPLSLDGDRLLGETRLIKDEYEVAQMIRAADISVTAHHDILALVRPGMTEVELEAELTYRFRKAGGDPCHAYQPIVAAGANACTLHHASTDVRMKSGDLVLVDAGCEHEGYASDITRTFPANGKFTPEQLAIYEIVLAAQKDAIGTARPGQLLCAVHDVAVLIICEGLMELKLLEKMNLKDAMEIGHWKRFFPHNTSHWLGLDVHDVGDYLRDADGKKRRVLKPGMVITVEPGIYIQPDMASIEKKWLGIGVRIEDDVLITEEGNRGLMVNL